MSVRIRVCAIVRQCDDWLPQLIDVTGATYDGVVAIVSARLAMHGQVESPPESVQRLVFIGHTEVWQIGEAPKTLDEALERLKRKYPQQTGLDDIVEITPEEKP